MDPMLWSRKVLQNGASAWRKELMLPSLERLHAPRVAATELDCRLGTLEYVASEAALAVQPRRALLDDSKSTPPFTSASAQEEELLKILPLPPRSAGGVTTGPDLGHQGARSFIFFSKFLKIRIRTARKILIKIP
jgi:hypothetical protein